MAEHDESNRAGKARERARLRATFGEEPGSGYAFHDEGRVERVRNSVPRRTSASVAPPALAAAREFSFSELASDNSNATARRPSYSAAAQAEAAHHLDVPPPDPDDDTNEDSHVRERPYLPHAERAPAKAAIPSPTAGSIWESMPSALATPPVPSDFMSGSPAEAPRPAPASQVPTVPLRSRPPPGEFQGAHHGRTADARFARLEPLVARSAWDQVLVELTHERDLPPVLDLLRLVARREIDPTIDAQDRHAVASDATLAVATLLGIAADSPVALVIAKRLLRRNPRGFRTHAPSPGVSTGLLAGGIAVGASIGWLFTRFFL